MDLDELLERSAPPTTPRNATLQDELLRVVASTEAAVRPRRRARRIGLVSVAATGVFGVGTAGAVATGIVPTPSWIPWSTADSACEMQFRASAAGPDGEPLSRHYAPAEKQRAVAEATRFLAAFDYSSINEAEAIRAWKDIENDAIAGQEPDERQPPLTGDDLALTAVRHEVWKQLSVDLTEHAIPTELIVFSTVWRCE